MAVVTPPPAPSSAPVAILPPRHEGRVAQMLRWLRHRRPIAAGIGVLLLLAVSNFGTHYITRQAADQRAAATTRHYDALLQDAQNQQTDLQQQVANANQRANTAESNLKTAETIVTLQKSRIDQCNTFISQNNDAFKQALTSANGGFGYNVNYHIGC
jgi:hypothetical protein